MENSKAFYNYYYRSLLDLKSESKPVIENLTEIAVKNSDKAEEVIEAITHVFYSSNLPLPYLYLLDSIIKRMREPFLTLIAPILADMFTFIFIDADNLVREKLYKIYISWKTVVTSDVIDSIETTCAADLNLFNNIKSDVKSDFESLDSQHEHVKNEIERYKNGFSGLDNNSVNLNINSHQPSNFVRYPPNNNSYNKPEFNSINSLYIPYNPPNNRNFNKNYVNNSNNQQFYNNLSSFDNRAISNENRRDYAQEYQRYKSHLNSRRNYENSRGLANNQRRHPTMYSARLTPHHDINNSRNLDFNLNNTLKIGRPHVASNPARNFTHAQPYSKNSHIPPIYNTHVYESPGFVNGAPFSSDSSTRSILNSFEKNKIDINGANILVEEGLNNAVDNNSGARKRKRTGGNLSKGGIWEEVKDNLCPGTLDPYKAAANIKILKMRNQSIIDAIMAGNQCGSCGLRFDAENREAYSAHLDMHFYRNVKKGKNTYNWRPMFYPLKQWAELDEIDPAKITTANPEPEPEKPSELVYALPSGLDKDICEVCAEKLAPLWSEDIGAWHYINVLKKEGKYFHKHCYELASNPDNIIEDVPSDFLEFNQTTIITD